MDDGKANQRSISCVWTNPSCWTLSSPHTPPCFLVTDPSKRPTHSYHHLLPEIIEYRNRNYKVVTGNLSWYDAMNKCKGHDSDLVSVTDAYHQAFLTFLVNRLGAPHWIGLYSVDVCTFCPLICYVLYTSVVCLCEILLCVSLNKFFLDIHRLLPIPKRLS